MQVSSCVMPPAFCVCTLAPYVHLLHLGILYIVVSRFYVRVLHGQPVWIGHSQSNKICLCTRNQMMGGQVGCVHFWHLLYILYIVLEPVVSIYIVLEPVVFIQVT